MLGLSCPVDDCYTPLVCNKQSRKVGGRRHTGVPRVAELLVRRDTEVTNDLLADVLCEVRPVRGHGGGTEAAASRAEG